MKVVAGNWENLTRHLQDYSLDLVAADIGDAGTREEFQVTKLVSEPLVWVAAPSHPLATRRQIPFKDLEPFPLAIPTAPAHMIQHLQQLPGFPIPSQLAQPHIQCDSYTALIDAVRRSRCLTALPTSLARQLVDRDELCALDIRDWALSSHAGIITLAKRAPSVAREAMEKAIIEVSSDISRENRQLV
jgi:DNA-binding transcriptional LysR family regulator